VPSGLIDKTRASDPSAKLDMAHPALGRNRRRSHKPVFSQFHPASSRSSKRAWIRKRSSTEYLDGKTKDRQARVDRFRAIQKSSSCFSSASKGGRRRLNLTAADMSSCSTPGGTPPSSAAIDRTHRIGQIRQVFACRLIAKDTVEEKVLALAATATATGRGDYPTATTQ